MVRNNLVENIEKKKKNYKCFDFIFKVVFVFHSIAEEQQVRPVAHQHEHPEPARAPHGRGLGLHRLCQTHPVPRQVSIGFYVSFVFGLRPYFFEPHIKWVKN